VKRPVFDPSWPIDVQRVYEHDMREIWDSKIAFQVWTQYHAQLARYLSVASTPSIRILDVGCAQATLALLLAEAGHRVVAMDIRASFLEYAKSRYEKGDIRFVVGNATEADFREEFDIVFCNQLIEHLVHPEELVERLGRALAPGGRLIVTTPNGCYVRNSLPSFSSLGDRARYEARQFTADGDGHFFAYRADELPPLFRRPLFGSVEVAFFETPWVSGHMKLRYLQPRLGDSLLQRLDAWTLRIPWAGRHLAGQLIAIGTRAR
jgi:2-polyprenyl-3-methyl-5-hydroxy-6-metoxy-1,4-benzoquinol methylase